MAKSKTAARWQCMACGAAASGWFGRCPTCQEWNTIEAITDTPPPSVRHSGERATPTSSTQTPESMPRLATGIGEIDRVLGGGLVPGSLVLLGGAPGIGKSTLLLQASAALARRAGPVLYASGEESIAQIAGRAGRLEARVDELLLLAETNVEAIVETARAQDQLAALVVDSIQTVHSDEQAGLPGNLSQIRAATAVLLSFAKSSGVPVVIVGHVTKDGTLAGPRLLEHLVDAVLSFEGDEDRGTRLLRATKNRFGSTQELGVFEMSARGLLPVENPSHVFLSQRECEAAGACVTATLEGSRPLLVEVQALLAASFGGNPRRNSVGADTQRLAMLLAVLDRHAGMFVLDHDVFVNVVGGLRLVEPAADLAVAVAVASSHMRRALPAGTIVFGEVGLTGEIRAVPGTDLRLAEAARLGFRHGIVPRSRGQAKAPSAKKMQVTQVATLQEAVAAALELDTP